MSAAKVKRVENLINQRPIKKFNCQTHNEVFLQKLLVALKG